MFDRLIFEPNKTVAFIQSSLTARGVLCKESGRRGSWIVKVSPLSMKWEGNLVKQLHDCEGYFKEAKVGWFVHEDNMNVVVPTLDEILGL